MQNSVNYENFRALAISVKEYFVENNIESEKLNQLLGYCVSGIDYNINIVKNIENSFDSFKEVLPIELYSKFNHRFNLFLREFYQNYQIISTMDDILKSPAKYVEFGDFESIKIYLEGYLSGVGTMVFKNLIQMIGNWYKEQIETDFQGKWTDYIDSSPYDTKEKFNLIVKITKSYILNNPSWAYL